MIGRSIGLAALTAMALAGPSLAGDAPSVETIVFVRHGEKPAKGLGQLDCQGLNRALALPAVIAAKFGAPAAVFAPDPARRKDDEGVPYDYLRPLATVEPTAIRFGLPVDTSLGFADIAKLKDALEQPAYRNATILVGWEHKIIDVVVRQILDAHAAKDTPVPAWQGNDFDSIDIVRIDWSAPNAPASFEHGQEGLDGRPTQCPD